MKEKKKCECIEDCFRPKPMYFEEERDAKKDFIVKVAAAVWVLLVVLWMIFSLSCYSVPNISKTDTTPVQDQAKDSAKQLEEIPHDPSTSIGPKDQAVIYEADRALKACAASLDRVTQDKNDCAEKVQELAGHYKDQNAKLSQLEEENGIFGRMGRFMKTFFLGAVSGLVFMWLAQTFGSVIITAAIKAIKP